MNAFQTCQNTADAVPLYLAQKLFLKPAAKINISVQLPNVKKLEKSVSHWEIMEKLRSLIRPDEFSVLKVSKTTLEIVRFDAEIENRTRLDRVISKLDNNSIKLKEIPNVIRIKASEPKSDFPNRHKWDTFFQEARDMDEMKPGQRPDTIHLSHLPIKWFVPYHLSDTDDATPSEKILYRIFEKFGAIRYVDVPICDVYRKKMKDHISGIRAHSFDDKDFFEGYVQFKDYIGFTKAMEALKGMKLMKKEDDEALCVSIKVDFDRTKHLTDASVRRREIVRDRLVNKQREKEEKEKDEFDKKKEKEQSERQKEISAKSDKERRRRDREEKRKKKILDKLKINGCDELNDKIAKEEKKLLKAQRKLEAIRLLEELFSRIKDKKDEMQMFSQTRGTSGDELMRYKHMSELAVLTQRQKLHNAVEGRVVLKSILLDKKPTRNRFSSSDSEESSTVEKKPNVEVPSEIMYDPNWYAYAYPPPIYAPPMRGSMPMYPTRGRMPMRGPIAGSSRGRHFTRGRGYRNRYRGGFRGTYHYQYSPDTEEEYSRYFSKFFPEHDYRRSRSYSRSRSRSRRRSYTRSRSRSRERRSYTRSRSRSRSRNRSRRSRSRSHFTPAPVKLIRKNKSKSRSLSVDSSKFKSPKSVRKPRSWSKSPDGMMNKK